jgi:hypothetical protein
MDRERAEHWSELFLAYIDRLEEAAHSPPGVRCELVVEKNPEVPGRWRLTVAIGCRTRPLETEADCHIMMFYFQMAGSVVLSDSLFVSG